MNNLITQSIPAIPVMNSGGFMDPEKIVFDLGVSEGMRIADFGCGSGYFAILLGQLVGESGVVTALDILESALETVRAKAKIKGLSNIQTVRSNLEVVGSSGLDNQSQDAVLLANVLFQSPDKSSIISEATRVLRENGKLIVIDWRKGAGGGPPDELRTEEETMKSLAMGAGLSLERVIDAGAFHYGFIFRKIVA